MSNRKLYTSDLHLGHENIIGFDDRPFKDTKEMGEYIKERWNSKVEDSDIVYILGDVIWKNNKDSIELLKSLKGQKHLLKGNHDRLNKEIKDCFVSISDYKEIKDEGRSVILCHYPIPAFKNHYRKGGGYMLYGHVHDTEEHGVMLKVKDLMAEIGFPCEMYNVGCMLWDYTPMTLSEIIGVE